MSQEENPSSNQPAIHFRSIASILVAAGVTVALSYFAYLSWSQLVACEQDLLTAEKIYQETEAERTDLQTKATRLEVMKEQQKQARDTVRQLLVSFDRDDMLAARIAAIERAKPKQAVVISNTSRSCSKRLWIWIPEKGHRLWMQLSDSNLQDADVIGGTAKEIVGKREFELSPGKVHFFEFSVGAVTNSKSLLQIQFDDSIELKWDLQLEANSSSSGGRTQDVLHRLDYDNLSWQWWDDIARHVENKTWFLFDAATYGLAPLAEETSDPDEGEESPREVEFELQVGISGEGPVFMPASYRGMLAERGVALEKIEDSESPYFGLLRITGMLSEESKSTAETKEKSN
ncbi:MAG: hypothetical protein AAF483_27670 [Planctomycetota bacterium]